MQITDVMDWGKRELDLTPRQAFGMVDRADPAWSDAVDAFHINATSEAGELAAIIPVRPYFGGQAGAMAREILERESGPGVKWRVEIRRMNRPPDTPWGDARQAFRHTVGDEKFWPLAEEIAAFMEADVRANPKSHFLTFDFADMDRINRREPNRGKELRPHSLLIAERAAHHIEKSHPGAVESFRRWEGPWVLTALRVGYAALDSHI
jgi:hypothetical protein